MQISKYSFSKKSISWNEPFDLAYTVKMGSNQTISASYDGSVTPVFTPNNFTDIQSGVNFGAALHVSGAAENGNGLVYTGIGKGASKSFKVSGGYFDPDAIVYSSGEDKGLTLRELIIKRSGDNGASRVYPIGLLIEATDGYGDGGRVYTAHAPGAATFLLEREVPVFKGVTVTDDRIGAGGISALEHFGNFVRNESIPRMEFAYDLDPLAPDLVASLTLELYGPDGALICSHVMENGAVAVLNPEGDLIRSYVATTGAFVLDPLQVAGTHDWKCYVIDSAGSSNEMEGSFEVLPYKPAEITHLVVSRYTIGVDDSGTPIYSETEDGLHVRIDIEADISKVAGKNAWSMIATYGADDTQDMEKALFTATERADGMHISLTEDRSLITDEISPAYAWSFTFTLTDFFGAAVETRYVDKAGGDLNVEPYGTAIGMRSTATPNNKKFEVAPGYAAHFYGGINGLTNYSVGEVKVGGTYTDRKPIYRGVFVADVTTNENVTITSGLDIETVISLEGLISYQSSGSVYHRPMNYYNSDSNNTRLYAQDGDIITNSTRAGTATVFAVYTKKSDEPEGEAALLMDASALLMMDADGRQMTVAADAGTVQLRHTAAEVDRGIDRADSLYAAYQAGELGDKNYGAGNAGNLLYIGADGKAIPLRLGEGLEIVDGVLKITATIEDDTTAVLGKAILGKMILGKG